MPEQLCSCVTFPCCRSWRRKRSFAPPSRQAPPRGLCHGLSSAHLAQLTLQQLPSLSWIDLLGNPTEAHSWALVWPLLLRQYVSRASSSCSSFSGAPWACTHCAHRDTGSRLGSRAAECRTSSLAPVARGGTRVAHGHRLPTATARPVGTAT